MNPERTFLKNVDGTDIYVLPDGKFGATIGSKWIMRVNLRDVEKMAAQRVRTVQGIVLPTYLYNHEKPTLTEVIEVLPDGRARNSRRELTRTHGESVYLHDPVIFAQLLEINAQVDALYGRWRELAKQLRPLTREHHKALSTAVPIEAPEPAE